MRPDRQRACERREHQVDALIGRQCARIDQQSWRTDRHADGCERVDLDPVRHHRDPVRIETVMTAQLPADVVGHDHDMVGEGWNPSIQPPAEAARDLGHPLLAVGRQLRPEHGVGIVDDRHLGAASAIGRGQQAFEVMGVHDIERAFAQPPTDQPRQCRIVDRQLGECGPRRDGTQLATVEDPADREVVLGLFLRQMIGDDLDVMATRSQCLGQPLDAQGGATACRQRARGHHGYAQRSLVRHQPSHSNRSRRFTKPKIPKPPPRVSLNNPYTYP